jgi:DNA-binding CsgD family transcriptional regulator
MTHFNGPDYQAERDHARLTAQQSAIFELVKDGTWRTLGQIAQACDAPEASVSAQLRHLRKERFGAHTVNKRYVRAGLYEYQLVPNTTEPQ